MGDVAGKLGLDVRENRGRCREIHDVGWIQSPLLRHCDHAATVAPLSEKVFPSFSQIALRSTQVTRPRSISEITIVGGKIEGTLWGQCFCFLLFHYTSSTKEI